MNRHLSRNQITPGTQVNGANGAGLCRPKLVLEERSHFTVETDADQDDVGLRPQRGCVGDPCRTTPFHLVPFRAIDIRGERWEPLAHQMPDDRQSHAACADHAYGLAHG